MVLFFHSSSFCFVLFSSCLYGSLFFCDDFVVCYLRDCAAQLRRLLVVNVLCFCLTIFSQPLPQCDLVVLVKD